MSRPKNKSELLELSEVNYERLQNLIKAFGPEERSEDFPAGTMNRNIRDVIAHLHHWHSMMLEWYQVGMSGEMPIMPSLGYTWKTVPKLNRWIWEHYQDTPLEDAQSRCDKGYDRLRAIIKSHSDEELFTATYYPWTGSTSLGSYLISATSSHYDWAWKLIRKAKK